MDKGLFGGSSREIQGKEMNTANTHNSFQMFCCERKPRNWLETKEERGVEGYICLKIRGSSLEVLMGMMEWRGNIDAARERR